MTETCTARRPDGTYDDPESCGCESCVAWAEARGEAMDHGPEIANPDW